MPSTTTAINSAIAIVVWRRRLRMRWDTYFETAAAGLLESVRTTGVPADGDGATIGAGATAGAVVTGGCDALKSTTGGAGTAGAMAGADFGGASARAMTIEGAADAPPAAALCAEAALSPAGSPAAGAGSLAAGITNLAPQAGQMPRLPAKLSLTLSLCPFGQEKRIPIPHVYLHWRSL
jgi:hypothetical protein